MLDIKATFENGETQHFGEPSSLLRYMQEEGHNRVEVTASYIFTPFCQMKMGIKEVEGWVELGEEGGVDSAKGASE